MTTASKGPQADDQLELETVGITKRYGPLVANDGIDLQVRTGEVHAVMGENGAGKSTLMSILYGMQRPDAGQIVLRGGQVRFRSALDAISSGIGMVHQGFKLFEPLTVWENVVLGKEPRRNGFIDRRKAIDAVAGLGDRYGLKVDPCARINRLSVGIRQRVEILKALYRDARLLILDEPTAVLTPQERDGLFEVIRGLRNDGRTVLFVTHKMHEVMSITDRVTVLRQGRVSARMETLQTSPDEIVSAMTGRAVRLVVQRDMTPAGEVVLETRGLTVRSAGARPLLEDVALTVRAHEIVGVAGVAGNGQSELVEAIAGLRPSDSGTVHLGGVDITREDVRERRAAGLAYVPEDRAFTGTALPASAADNLVMGVQRSQPFWRWGLLDRQAVIRHARQLIERFGIKIASERTAVGTLSGGNLQKIVVARELSRPVSLLVAEQPTRGVDVGAIEYIHAQLVEESRKGCGILLVSAEMSELLALSDRILVMYEGRIIAEMDASSADETQLGLLMAGGKGAAQS